MKEIKLTKNQVAFVDDEDHERITRRAWYFRDGFAMRSKRKPASEGGKIKHVRMHHEILGVEPFTNIIHINGNKLDNRRSNLRIAANR